MKPSDYTLHDPIVAIATALVPSALGIVRASGKQSIDMLCPFFSRPQALSNAKGNSIVYGWIIDGESKIDEVVVSIYRAPKSFTGEDSVEITCHGGPSTVLAIFRTLIKAGFRPAEKGEFTFRSFANGKTDLTRAEAVKEIIEAKTGIARDRAAGRLAGNLSTETNEIQGMIMTALAAIEVEIEYPEDEETTSGAYDSKLVKEAENRLRSLESTWATEKLYHEGAKVVLAGRTNAGKSSLFNSLLKVDRAIVSDIHGTTRDWLESVTDFGGIPVNLYDTAGLRHTADHIEAEGVERSKTLATEADLVLYLVDSTLGISNEDRDFFTERKAFSDSPVILVWNKADHEKAQPLPKQTEDFNTTALCSVSAKKGTGIAELVAQASQVLHNKIDSSSVSQQVSLGTERQKTAVRSALSSLEHATKAAHEGFPMDAIAQDLEDALCHLGEITGETTAEDILDNVFSGFCVGK